jgi:hypothetical protein
MSSQRTRYSKTGFGSVNRIIVERGPLKPNEKYSIQLYRHKVTGQEVRMAEKQLGTRGWPAEDYELASAPKAPAKPTPKPSVGLTDRQRAALEADLKRMTMDALRDKDEWDLVPSDVQAACTNKGDIVSAILDVSSQL